MRSPVIDEGNRGLAVFRITRLDVMGFRGSMGADAGLGPEEHLLVAAAPVSPRLLDRQKLAAFPLRSVQHHHQLPPHTCDAGDRCPFHGLERLRRVELPLAQTKDLLAGTGPGSLRVGARSLAGSPIDV